MTISNYLTIAASTLLVTACATNNAQKNTEIAETGLIYVEKVDKLIGETLDLVYEVDASVLLETRSGSNKKKTLEEKTKSTLKLTRELTTFRKSNTNTKRYFEAVQALINNPTRDSMGDTIGNISATIARENHRQRNKLALYASPYEHESYLRQLSKMTVNAHYAKQIQNILRQDKDIISQHLALQKKQLKQIATIYERHMETASRLYFKNNVQKPYLEAQHLTLPSWAPSRREWLEMKLTELNLDELIDAHRNVKKAWARLFQGTSNASDINHMLTDTNELVDTASHLRKASQTTTPDLVNLSTSTIQ